MSDLMGWVTWLRNTHDQLWVGLWGNSFGASIGLGLATRPVGGGFDAMVLDSPAVTADGIYSGVIQSPSTRRFSRCSASFPAIFSCNGWKASACGCRSC